jgi:1-acyl-sn-glycerol-3-phosphate acyltransferase
MAAARASLKLAGFVLLTLILIPFQAMVCGFGRGRTLFWIPSAYHKTLCLLFGIRVRPVGVPVRDSRVLYVSNHLSYLDILVLSSLLPTSFVAKKEVRDWPFFGLLARLQKTVFIDRSRAAARKAGGQVQKGLEDGCALVLFPEGTSSDGRNVLPFRSSLFGAIDAFPEALVQPVTVCLEGPVTNAQRDLYAWYGDMDLIPHLWAFASGHGARVRVVFHPPLSRQAQGTDRKEWARAAYEAVEKGLLSGVDCPSCAA